MLLPNYLIQFHVGRALSPFSGFQIAPNKLALPLSQALQFKGPRGLAFASYQVVSPERDDKRQSLFSVIPAASVMCVLTCHDLALAKSHFRSSL